MYNAMTEEKRQEAMEKMLAAADQIFRLDDRQSHYEMAYEPVAQVAFKNGASYHDAVMESFRRNVQTFMNQYGHDRDASVAVARMYAEIIGSAVACAKNKPFTAQAMSDIVTTCEQEIAKLAFRELVTTTNYHDYQSLTNGIKELQNGNPAYMLSLETELRYNQNPENAQNTENALGILGVLKESWLAREAAIESDLKTTVFTEVNGVKQRDQYFTPDTQASATDKLAMALKYGMSDSAAPHLTYFKVGDYGVESHRPDGSDTTTTTIYKDDKVVGGAALVFDGKQNSDVFLGITFHSADGIRPQSHLVSIIEEAILDRVGQMNSPIQDMPVDCIATQYDTSLFPLNNPREIETATIAFDRSIMSIMEFETVPPAFVERAKREGERYSGVDASLVSADDKFFLREENGNVSLHCTTLNSPNITIDISLAPHEQRVMNEVYAETFAPEFAKHLGEISRS